jgi:hypothetical protein
MATRRLYDGATIEIGQVPIESVSTPPSTTLAWLKVGGVWKQATVHIKVSGVWKTATPKIKAGVTWK